MINRFLGTVRQHRAERTDRSPAQAASTYTRIGLPGRPPFVPARARWLTIGTVILVLIIATGWLARGRLAERTPPAAPAPSAQGPEARTAP
jgi:hypothetical protein